LYHQKIDIYIAVFEKNTDLSSIPNVKSFVKTNTSTFVLNIDAKLGYTFVSPHITHSYRDLSDNTNVSEINDGDDYVMVIYSTLAGSNTPTKQDAYKLIHFNKTDFTPPEVHRFVVNMIN